MTCDHILFPICTGVAAITCSSLIETYFRLALALGLRDKGNKRAGWLEFENSVSLLEY